MKYFLKKTKKLLQKKDYGYSIEGTMTSFEQIIPFFHLAKRKSIEKRFTKLLEKTMEDVKNDMVRKENSQISDFLKQTNIHFLSEAFKVFLKGQYTEVARLIYYHGKEENKNKT